MKEFRESLAVMLGKAPRKPAPEEFTEGAKRIHQAQRAKKIDMEALRREAREHEKRHYWRNRRWAVLIVVNLLFVLSYRFDVQLVEGALTASRVLGFHFADLNSSLQVTLAFKQVLVNLFIGTTTVFLLWWVFGGRGFCSWTCPYHLLAEFAEKIHLKLAEKKLVTDHAFHRGVRTVFYVLFALLALVTGYTVYETISPVGIVSRALIYGPGLALLWVLLLLLFEIFYSRRAWCRYVCPIGLTYGLVGSVSPFKVTYDLDKCEHEGECRKVCMVPHVLECVIKGRAHKEHIDIGADCTRCGMCIDVCPSQALRYEFKGLSKFM
ncbi:MAG: NapH/MauN family ferredoxin-type protein [Gammaproteobacteria bacterium]